MIILSLICETFFWFNSTLPECCSRQESCCAAVVSHIADSLHRVPDVEVDDGVDGHGHAVLGEDLLGWNIETYGS